MFGNKERRDIALLIFMALVVIGFLAYLFLPSGEGKGADTAQAGQVLPDKKVVDKSKNPQTDDLLAAYNARLEAALASFFQQLDDLELLPQLPAPEVEAALYNVRRLKDGGGKGRQLLDILEKIRRLSVYNIKDLLDFEYPKEFGKNYLFNVYTAALVAKIAAENITWHVSTASNNEVRSFIDFSIYNMLGNELEKDYQTLPALLYLELLLKKFNFYTEPGQLTFFQEELGKLRDLTPQKLLLHMAEYLSFTEERSLFRLEWRENDDLDPDDVGVYQKLNLPCVHFLKQKYLVFPAQKAEDNVWISELCNADSGDIELDDLTLSSEDPGKSIRLNRVLYTPDTARFIFVLGEDASQAHPVAIEAPPTLLDRRIAALIREVEKNYKVIDCASQGDEEAQAQKQQQLRDFGIYLKNTNF